MRHCSTWAIWPGYLTLRPPWGVPGQLSLFGIVLLGYIGSVSGFMALVDSQTLCGRRRESVSDLGLYWIRFLDRREYLGATDRADIQQQPALLILPSETHW